MKYNKNKTGTPTITTHQGGTGYQQAPEIALLSLLATGLDKTFYEGSNDREKRLVELIEAVAAKDKYFAAQCIVYARVVYGQRTVTHRAAVALASLLDGEEWGKRFFGRWNKKKSEGGVIFRLDDILEIAACYQHFNPSKRFSNPMTKGFAQALSTADEFELSRYKGDGKSIGLVDIVNLVHPKPTDHNKGAFLKLMTGKLTLTGTVESDNSEAGRVVAEMKASGAISATEAEAMLVDLKGDNFKKLMTPDASGKVKIGYLALLRNLRNLVNADPALLALAKPILTNADQIKKSLVFPHQIDLALELLQNEFPGRVGRQLIDILDTAYEMSVSNVRELNIDEDTAVVIDASGSMHMSNYRVAIGQGTSINSRPIDKAALIGATLGKAVSADVFIFGDRAAQITYNPKDTINTLKNGFLRYDGVVGHGTYLDLFWELANKGKKTYKRVFIISDMQIADGVAANGSNYKQFVNRVGEPYIYAIDLVGYGNQPLKKSNHYFNIAGYSAQIYETAKRYEVDPVALINEVKAIKI